jgi:hypothetical protein
LYGAAGDTGVATMLDVSSLPSEAKPALMVRLMSATLIELTSKETLAMVSCADDCWNGEGRKLKKNKKQSTNSQSDLGSLMKIEEVKNEEADTSIIHGEEKHGQNNTTGSAQENSPAIQQLGTAWPPPAKSRHVSEATVEAVVDLITGAHRKDDPLTGGGDYILLPEGLLLLFGLLSTKSVAPAVRCRCMTLVGMWVKTSHENAMAVLRCSRWQRWFVGIHSSSLRLFHQSAMDLNKKQGNGNEDNNSATDDNDSERASIDSCGSMMTSLIVDALSALYKTLLHDVKRGYEHWSVLHALTRDMPAGTYFCRAVVVTTLRRSHQTLSQTIAPLNTATRRASLRNSLTMPNHLADNLASTFQFVDELLLGVSPSSWSISSSTPSTALPSISTYHHSSNLPDLLDDRLTARRVASVPETSLLECTGSYLISSILPVVQHMRRCGAMKYSGSTLTPYPPLASSKSGTSAQKDEGSSRCLSWRLAPVVRVVLSIMESSGVTENDARELSLQFLQALVSNELSSGIVGMPDEQPTTQASLERKEHARRAVLRIIGALGRCMFSDDVVMDDSQREAHGVMLIAIANNHDVSPSGQEGHFTPEMMRPQGNENASDTSKRILAILEEVLRSVCVGRGGGDLPPTPSCLASPLPMMFANPKKRTQKSAQNMKRSLAHSDADVAELSNRQSARSALDRQRLATSVSEILLARANLRAWYNEKTWPTMLAAQCGVWDSQVVEREKRRRSTLARSIEGSLSLASLPSPTHLVRELVQHEEHLFSRRRRFHEVSVHPQMYEKRSYSSFSAHRIRDEKEADKRMLERKRKLKELHDLASGIANAMGGAGDDDDDDDASAAAIRKKDGQESSSNINNKRDGWEAEDDEWDRAAKISEARARTSVMGSPSLATADSPRNRQSTVSVASVDDSDEASIHRVLFRDDRCASIVPDLPEPVMGTLILTSSALVFEPRLSTGDKDDRALYDERSRRSPLSQFRRIYLRSYCLVDNSFEVLLTGGRSAFYHFCVSEGYDDASGDGKRGGDGTNDPNKKKKRVGSNSSASKQRRDTLVSLLLRRLPRKVRSWSQSPGQSSRRYFEASQITRAWQDRALSNFDYLMALNTMAGRSHNDLSQYPVFPWILTQFDKEEIDLTDPKVYRDLRKPVGALNSKRLEEFRERYDTFDDPIIPKFLYGSHYSTAAGVVLYFLLRQEPYTSLHVETQDGHFDVPDRLFSSVKQAWDMCYGSLSEVKELTPEFYYSPEFLTNHNNLPLGTTQDGTQVHDVELPPWANNDSTRFVSIMREALESEHVSQYLHRWVDLIFGYKQRGPEAVKAHNIFYYLTYEGAVQLEQIRDVAMRKATELQIVHFGQCPRRLLRSPHPPRGNCVRMPRSLLLSVGSEFVEIVRRARLLSSKGETNDDHHQHPPLISLAEHALSSFSPGFDSLVRLGFPPSRALDALEAASDDVDNDEGYIDGELTNEKQEDVEIESGGTGGVDGIDGGTDRGSGSSATGGTGSSSGSASSSFGENRRASIGSNRKYLWRTDQDPRSKTAAMTLAQSGDLARVPPFTREHAQVHTSSPLPIGDGSTPMAFVAVRCLPDRIHAVSSDGVVHSYRITRNAAPNDLNMISSNDKHETAKNAYAAEKQSRIAARAAADFVPLSVHVVSPSTSTPNDEKLSVPVCWEVDVAKINTSPMRPANVPAGTGSPPTSSCAMLEDGAYRPPVCWSSAGSVLACATGATGSIVLWGVDKDSGVRGSSEKYCSVAVNGEASASGGHWSSVTTLSISSDTLLSGSADGMVLLWFLCRVPRSKRPAVSSRPYHLLRGHRAPVLLSAMSHAVGVAVTSSVPSEILVHRLPRPPPLGPGFEPSTE